MPKTIFKLFFSTFLYFFSGLICFFILTGVSKVSAAVEQGPQELCYKKNCFKVDIAGDRRSRRLGLMHKVALPESHGMLLVFDRSGYHPIWMKNVNFPLDLLWLDENFQIVDIRSDAQPCLKATCPTYIPTNKAFYVLELASGQSQKAGLKIGQFLKSATS